MSIASFAKHRYRRLRDRLRGEPKRFENVVDRELEERLRAKHEELQEQGVEVRPVLRVVDSRKPGDDAA